MLTLGDFTDKFCVYSRMIKFSTIPIFGIRIVQGKVLFGFGFECGCSDSGESGGGSGGD